MLVRMHSLDLFADVFGEAGPRSGVLAGRDADDRAGRLGRDRRAQRGRRRVRCRASIDLRAGKPVEGGDAVRDYGIGAQILAELGVHDMILLTNTHHSPVGARRLRPRHRRRAADRGWRLMMATILIVEARFYPHLNDLLLAGARAAIEAAGHKHETITVPGALEVPGAIALAARERPLLRLRRAWAW